MGFVGQQLICRRYGIQHDGQHLDVGGLPRGERKNERPTLAVAQGMDLNHSTIAGATNRLTLPPLFLGGGRRAVRFDVSAVGQKLDSSINVICCFG
jgi:hypothetical protein